MKPLHRDVFCGYGGWAVGAMDAGFQSEGWDIEPKVGKRYPGKFTVADVREMDGKDLRGAQLLTLSPPCQKFSTANSKNRNPEEGMKLVREAIRIKNEADPVFWVLEYVRGAMRYISAELGEPRN